jgi:hypothetical protein
VHYVKCMDIVVRYHLNPKKEEVNILLLLRGGNAQGVCTLRPSPIYCASPSEL